MKRKLTIAAGIVHKPEILFLDEPTTGLDVVSARQLRQLIATLRDAGTTIFLTTHNIEEAERLCDRVAFIVSGRIVESDTVENLVRPVRAKRVVEITCASIPDAVQGKLAPSFLGLEFSASGYGRIRVEADGPIHVGQLVRFLEDEGVEVEEARRLQPSLEDVFVESTGIGAEAMRQEKEPGGSQ
jgi:ABC-2 type transport system ATP-binding protein